MSLDRALEDLVRRVVREELAAVRPGASAGGARLLRESAAAEYLGIPPETLRSMRGRGEIQAIKRGRTPLYDRAELDRWIDAHRPPAPRPTLVRGRR